MNDKEKISGLKRSLLKKFGGRFVTMSEMEEEETQIVSTGSLRLDIALDEPLHPGFHEISGNEGSGKTTLSLEAGAAAQAEGMTFWYVGIERGLHRSLPKGISGLNRKKMEIIQPHTGEDALNIIENILRTIPRSFIVIDSVPALVSEEEMGKKSGDETMAKLARMLHKFMKKMVSITEDQKSVILFINQLRDNVGGYGPKDTTPGGRAIPFYSSSRIKLKATKSSRREDSRGNIIGHTIEAEILKNRATIPFKKVEVELLYGKGIDRNLELLNLAVDAAIIDRNGAWFSYKDEKIGQGKNNACEYLQANQKVFKKITKEIKELYGYKG